MKKVLILVFSVTALFVGCTEHKTQPLADGILVPAAFYETSIVAGAIYDFADFNNSTAGWIPFTDTVNGGDSTSVIYLKEKSSLDKYVHCDYVLGPALATRYACLRTTNMNLDVSQYAGMAFELRGSGHKFKINLDTPGVTDYDYYNCKIDYTPKDWTFYVYAFSDFKRDGWGTNSHPVLDLLHLIMIDFRADSQTSKEQGWFEMDNVRFVEKIIKR